MSIKKEDLFDSCFKRGKGQWWCIGGGWRHSGGRTRSPILIVSNSRFRKKDKKRTGRWRMKETKTGRGTLNVVRRPAVVVQGYLYIKNIIISRVKQK